MTAETLVVVDEAHFVREIRPHIRCCEVERFYCRAPFHPEVEATEACDEEAACATCVDIRYDLLCPQDRPTHQHCPFTGKPCPADA